MRGSKRTDAEILARAEADARGSVLDMIGRRLREDIKPTADEAYRLLSEEGRPGVAIAKVLGVSAGCVVMADGVYNIISGVDEEVDDLFVRTRNDSNYVRIFTGASELALGAMLAYLGAVKGPIR